MSHLLCPAVTLCMCLTSLSCTYYPDVAGAYHQNGRQTFDQGELGPANTQIHNAIRIGSGFMEVNYRPGLTDATLRLCSDARCVQVQEVAKHMEANLAPTGAQGAAHEFEPTRPARVSAVNSYYAAVTKKFRRVSESIAVTPEPVSLALFGSGLTLAGVALLRCSQRKKWSRTTRDAHYAVEKSCMRLARNANRVQYPAPDFPAPDRFVTTCMPPAPK
jgi:hypothetical protein